MLEKKAVSDGERERELGTRVPKPQEVEVGRETGWSGDLGDVARVELLRLRTHGTGGCLWL